MKTKMTCKKKNTSKFMAFIEMVILRLYTHAFSLSQCLEQTFIVSLLKK